MALGSYPISPVLPRHRVQPAPRDTDASICTNAAFAGNRHSTDLCLALPWDGANVLFTLAAGVCVTEVLRQQGARTQHIIFAIGVAVTFAFPSLTKTGWEFGIDGVLFPAAILLVLAGRRDHIVWLLLLVVGQNWYGEFSPGEPWVLDALIVLPMRASVAWSYCQLLYS